MTGGRRWLVWTSLAYLVVIAAVVLGLLGLYRAARDRLDEAMGDRLLAVANALAVTSDARQIFAITLGDSTASAYIDSLSDRLDLIRRLDDLAEVTLCDPDGRILLSTSSGLKAGHTNDFWELDRAAVDLACQGYAQATRLYRLQDTFQKSAHAPILLDDPILGEPLVVAIVTVSGSPDFFDALTLLRRGAFATGAAVLIVLVLMGAVLYRLNVAVEDYRARVMHQENLAAMGRMTAGIAHEIRNPLGIIRGAGQHLQRVLQDAGIEEPVADFIPEEVDRLDQILGGYLAFGSDKAAASEVFDATVIVRRSARLVEPELAETGCRIDLPDDLPGALVAGDPRRLQQVMLNLLLNARDATAGAGGGLVALTLTEAGGRVTLTVRDEGLGLAGADRKRLFEPFWTSKEKGSGLGLAMSRKIIEDMGGCLDLRDRDDRTGAVAEVVLPVHQA